MSRLTVTWNLASPTPPARSWHCWASGANGSPEDERLSLALSWPRSTVAVLHEAFQQKLSRSTGWDLSSIQDDRNAWLEAARYFRRGVTVKGETSAGKKGEYAINFFPAQEKPPLTFNPGDFVVIEEGVLKTWEDSLKLPSHLPLSLNEQSKTLATVAKIVAVVQQEKTVKRLVLVGGGILCDVAAFAASLLSLPFTMVPTTLLAMVDASVGGKTGVNFPPFGKNQVGSFAFPEEVLIWTGWLKTLPPREYRAGLAEAIKHAIIKGDSALLEQVSACQRPGDALDAIIRPLVAVKAEIVAQDPNELGKRAVLNLGHTLAHALEAVSHDHSPKDPILHGEAVALGIFFALVLSQEAAGLGAADGIRLKASMKQAALIPTKDTLESRLGMSLEDPRLWPLLTSYFAQDKKGPSRWVLLKGLGKFAQDGESWTLGVAPGILETAWHKYLAELT